MTATPPGIDSSSYSPPAFASHDTGIDSSPLDPTAQRNVWILLGLFLLAIVLAYGNMLLRTASYWNDPLYSHGWIVPIIAAFLFHIRKRPFTQVRDNERWIGLGIITFCLCVRTYASYYDYAPLDRLSFVGTLIGLCQLVGGFRMVSWAGWPVSFLLFMFPLPAILENSLLSYLQKLAAISSNLVLQTMGIASVRDGSRIIIDNLTLGVVDACSGLRMLTIFCSLAVAMALMIDRPWWDRLIILISAIPIALVANIIRITITALLYVAFGQENELLKHIIHDYAGLAMMPIGLGILWVEMQLLSHITVPVETDDYAHLGAAIQ